MSLTDLLRLLLVVLFLGVPAPAPAGTLRSALSDDLTTIDPFAFSGMVGTSVLRQVYEGLTAMDGDGRVAPALATAWETTDGGRSWRISLRHGVSFQSGREFTAADVAWTWAHHLARKPQPGYATFYLRDIVGAAELAAGKADSLAGVTIADPHTLTVRLTRPDVLFPLYPIQIVDRGMEAEHGPGWVEHASGGTGPFRLTSWQRGGSVRLEANSRYWAGAPGVDGVELAILPNPNTLLARFDAGALDMAPLPENAVRTVIRNPRYAGQVKSFLRAQIRYLCLNQTLYPPFRDRRVREAVRLTLDRIGAVDGLYAGRAVLTDGMTTPGFAGYRTDLPPPPPADPQRARALLAEAGFTGGHGLPPLDIAAIASVREEATYYAAQLSSVLGIPVGVRIMERGTFIAAINAGREALFFNGWTADYPDPIDQLATQWLGDSPTNRSRWSDPAFDRLIVQARGLPEPEARHRLYQQAERMLHDAVAGVPLPIPQYVALVRPGVSGVTIRPDGTVDYRGARLP